MSFLLRHPHGCAVLFPLLILIALMAGPARADGPALRGRGIEVLFTGKPAEGLLTTPDHIIVTDSHTVLFRRPGLREAGVDCYLLAVPPGELKLDFQEVILRNRQTGEEVPALGDREMMGTPGAGTGVHGRSELTEFGWMRGVRVALVRINRNNPVYVRQTAWEIASYKLVVSYPPAPPAVPYADSAMKGGLYRQFLQTAIVNDAGIDRFASEPGPDADSAPTAWQPLPELSPDFPWLKIPIVNAGLHAIDGRWLQEQGLDPASVRPDDLYLFARGQRVALDRIGPAEAGFEGGTRLVFYALGNASDESAEEVYFLGRRPEGVAPLPFEQGPAYDAGSLEVATYQRRFRAEKDETFQTKVGSFLTIRKMSWTWADLTSGEPAEVLFDAPGFVLAEGGDTCSGSIELYFQDDHIPFSSTITLTLNGREVLTKEPVQRRRTSVSFTVPCDILQRNQNRLAVTWTPGPRPGNYQMGTVALDYVELTYPSQFSAEEGIHEVVLADVAGEASGSVRLRGTGFRTPRLSAIDVTNPGRPVRLAAEADRGVSLVQADVQPGSRILLAENDLIPRAPAASASRWEDWRGNGHSASAVIITHADFRTAAEHLAQDLRSQKMEVAIADVEGIYESFNHGNLSAEAVRRFLRHAVRAWEGRRPEMVILIGDCTGDGRGIARNGIRNFVPTATLRSDNRRGEDSFASDQFFAWLNGDDEVADLLVGRISVTTLEDAMAVVRNISSYRKDSLRLAPHAAKILAITDAGEFQEVAEGLEERAIDPAYEVEHIRANDAVWVDNYYLPEEFIRREQDRKVSTEMTSRIETAINEGQALTMFLGHGAPNLWSNQRFWFGGGTVNSDILRLKNKGMLTYAASFTCNNAVIDYPLPPWNICIAEDFMRHEGIGAVSCFMPSGPGYTTQHELIADGFFRAWTQLGTREHGLMAELGRLNYQATKGFDDHSRMFVFLGDPSLRMPAVRKQADRTEQQTRDLQKTGGDLLIKEILLDGGESARGMRQTWNVVLSNESPRQKILPLKASLTGENGAVVDRDERFISIPPLRNRMESVTLEVPEAGAYMATFEIPHESGAFYVDRFPTRHFSQTLFFGQKSAGIQLVDGSVKLLPGVSRNSKNRLEILIANPTGRMVSAMLSAKYLRAGRAVKTDSRSIANLSGGKVTPVTFDLGSVSIADQDMEVEFTLVQRLSDGTEVLADSYRYKVEPASLPDLYIDPTSVWTEPAVLSDGMTVFVHGVAGNRGGSLSPPVHVGLFRAEDSALDAPLPDLTRSAPLSLPPMKPGERVPFRLRWDPEDNAGAYDIFAAVDSGRQVVEANEENNVGWTALRVNTKWRLSTGELRIRPEPNQTLVLAAEIGNTGETPARNILVTFYRSPGQAKEDKIGEVIVPIIGPHEIVPAIYEWKLTAQDMNLDPTRLSFTAAIQGSLQRISSVE